MNIIRAIEDENLFAPWFRDPKTWAAWFSFLKVFFGLKLGKRDLALYQQCTGRDDRPKGGFREVALVCGRRAGKSFVLALIAVHLAVMTDYSPYLQPGERATIMVIAADRKQARVIFRYIAGLLTKIEMLAGMVERETSDLIELTNNVSIEIQTASFRAVRGYTIAACLADEIAFWADEGANPDRAIIESIKPAMATIPNSVLLLASSPYARRGVLWDSHKKHHGKNGDPVLVWQAATRTMNPTVPQSVIDAAMDDDPASAAAEYGAIFRTDCEALLPSEVIESVVVPQRYELAPMRDIAYSGFIDFASGSGSDSLTLAISHLESNTAVLDCMYEQRPPFSPSDTMREVIEICRRYGVHTLCGDHWGGMFPREYLIDDGITYRVSPKPKSDLYRDVLPHIRSGRVQLLDHPRLIQQFCGLERRVARGGKDSIDHGPAGHDDCCNAATGSLLMSLRGGAGSGLAFIGVPSRRFGITDGPGSERELDELAIQICGQTWDGRGPTDLGINDR